MIWAALAALTLLRLVVAGAMPLAPDEAYYWVWSRALAPGYLDHPPMVAAWIWLGTGLAGPGPPGIRLLAPLSAAAGSVLLAKAANDLFPARAPQIGLTAAALLNATLLFGVGAVTMTPDTPLLFFWTFSLFALGRLHRTGNGIWWLPVGAGVGFAMCSKYTAILLAAGIVLWVLGLPGPRQWLRNRTAWAGAVLALVIFLPTFAWNARHGWASFAKQGGRGFVWDPAGALRHLGELAGGQAGLATPLVFVLCVAGIGSVCVAMWRSRDAGAGLLAALSVPPVLLFVEHALGDRVQANWPAIVFPAASIAAACLGGRWILWRKPAVVLGFAITFVAYLQATLAPLPLPPRLDPTQRLAGWPSLADAIGAAAAQKDAQFVAADSYGDAALLARLLPEGIPVIGVEPRWALFALPDARPLVDGRRGLLVRAARRTDAPAWGSAAMLEQLWRGRAGAQAELFDIFVVAGLPPGVAAVELPSGAGEW